MNLYQGGYRKRTQLLSFNEGDALYLKKLSIRNQFKQTKNHIYHNPKGILKKLGVIYGNNQIEKEKLKKMQEIEEFAEGKLMENKRKKQKKEPIFRENDENSDDSSPLKVFEKVSKDEEYKINLKLNPQEFVCIGDVIDDQVRNKEKKGYSKKKRK